MMHVPVELLRAWCPPSLRSSWLILAGLTLTGCIRVENQLASPPPPEVSVAQPLQRQIRLFYESTGVTEAFKAVQIRSRVRGFIERIAFDPGETIPPGVNNNSDTTDRLTSGDDPATANCCMKLNQTSIVRPWMLQ